MNEENNTQEEVSQGELKKQFCTVTPFSKFLALALFVMLPFVGFVIGFNYASKGVGQVVRVSGDTVMENAQDEPILLTLNNEVVACDQPYFFTEPIEDARDVEYGRVDVMHCVERNEIVVLDRLNKRVDATGAYPRFVYLGVEDDQRLYFEHVAGEVEKVYVLYSIDLETLTITKLNEYYIDPFTEDPNATSYQSEKQDILLRIASASTKEVATTLGTQTYINEEHGFGFKFLHQSVIIKESKNRITISVPTKEHGNIEIMDIYPSRMLIDLSEEIGIKEGIVELTEKFFNLDKDANFNLPDIITYKGSAKVDTKNGVRINYNEFQSTNYIILDNMDGSFFEIAQYVEHQAVDNSTIEFLIDPNEVFEEIINSFTFNVQ